MKSGARSLIGEAISWVAALGLCALALSYYDEIKAAIVNGIGVQFATPADDGASIGTARPRAATQRASGGSVELRLARDGHFHADAEINGRSIEVLVDTGATMVALTYEDAERAGIFVRDSDFTQRVSTANGTGRVAPVTIERISIGDITVRNVKAAVAEPGRLWKSLLGMAFIGRLSRAEMRSGVLLLEE